MIANKLNAKRNEINTDCDGISILLTASNLDDSKKQEIKSFLSLFGTDLSFRCGLPQNVVGSSRKDGVFSCAGITAVVTSASICQITCRETKSLSLTPLLRLHVINLARRR